MRVVTHLNVAPQEIAAKHFNVCLGISLGNSFFLDKRNMREYIRWALEHTREHVAILVPDTIHAVNYEVRNGYSREKAMRVALRKGREWVQFIHELLEKFTPAERKKIAIVTWEDLERDNIYSVQKKLVYEEFHSNKEFQEKVRHIVRDSVSISDRSLSEEDILRLSEYVLDELPVLIAGFSYEGKYYNLLPYPGISDIDRLVVEIQKKNLFPQLQERLNPAGKMGLVEVYPDPA